MYTERLIPASTTSLKQPFNINGTYVIDKSMLIKTVLESSQREIRFLFPSGFGKSFNMRMLKHFLSNTDNAGEFNFPEMNIGRYPDLMRLRGAYSVIFISFLSLKADTFKEFLLGIRHLIVELYRAHDLDYLNRSTHNEQENLLAELRPALARFMEMIYSVTQRPLIVLVDECDIPLQTACNNGYGKEASLFISDFCAFKNDKGYLEKVIIASVLDYRCSRGVNVSPDDRYVMSPESSTTVVNFDGVGNSSYGDYFGFDATEMSGVLTQMYGPEKCREYLEKIKPYYFYCRNDGRCIYQPSVFTSFLEHVDRFIPHSVVPIGMSGGEYQLIYLHIKQLTNPCDDYFIHLYRKFIINGYIDMHYFNLVMSSPQMSRSQLKLTYSELLNPGPYGKFYVFELVFRLGCAFVYQDYLCIAGVKVRDYLLQNLNEAIPELETWHLSVTQKRQFKRDCNERLNIDRFYLENELAVLDVIKKQGLFSPHLLERERTLSNAHSPGIYVSDEQIHFLMSSDAVDELLEEDLTAPKPRQFSLM